MIIKKFLSDIDVIAAKAKYANTINGILPTITNEKRLFFRDAFHPILYLNNKAKNAVTYPQTIELNNEERIIVISGPNAGGKSITLKNHWFIAINVAMRNFNSGTRTKRNLFV